MNLSQYSQLHIANYLLGTDFPTAPASLTIALSTADPQNDGSGIAEPVDTYVRQAITFDAPATTIGGQKISSSGAIVFPLATGSWGTITHIAIFSGSDLIFQGQLSAPKLISSGDTFSIDAGNIEFTLQDFFCEFFANIILNWMRGTDPAAAPAFEVALSSTEPLTDGSGITEPPGTDNYSRQTIVFGSLSQVLGTGTSIDNDNIILFGPVGTTDWSAVSYAAVYADSTNDLYIQSPLLASRVAIIGDTLPFPINSVNILIR